MCRPTRAYSVGSKQEHHKRKLLIDKLSTDPNRFRERAFSAGSRAKIPRGELSNTTGLPISGQSVDINGHVRPTNFLYSDVRNNNNNSMNSAIKNKKSSSAPTLAPRNQNQVATMDDLMELDFTKAEEESFSRSDEPSFSVHTPPIVRRGQYDDKSQSNTTKVNIDYIPKKPENFSLLLVLNYNFIKINI